MTRQMGEFERWASGIASTAVGSWGMRRGGIVGLIALAGAGFLAWRAGTGRSVVPEGGRALLEKAMPALTHEKDEAPRKAPARRASAKTSSARRSTAKATPARQGKSSTASARKPKAVTARSETSTPKPAKASPQRRKAAPAMANGSEAASKTIN